MKYLTKTIWILSLISMFTDIGSEMLYPVMPVYLKSIGFSIVFIGILEGVAEATAGLSKGYFGKLSDATNRRAPFVSIGYSLSAISKPMMALFVFPLWIFISRTIDRLGKGIRTGARDALLSDESGSGTKGKVFGFHRSMDTLGAVIGPSLALLYLFYHPENYKSLFFIAFIPGIITIFLSLLIKDKNKNQKHEKVNVRFFSFVNYWKTSPVNYRKVVTGLIAFALFNSSDVFLLLKVKQAGLSDTAVIGMYIFYNLVYAIFSFPAGIVADRIGLKKVFVAGLFIFAIVYSGMAFANNLKMFIALFLLYGIYAAFTEGISKALISNIVEKKDVATAIGSFSGYQSISIMIASTTTGILWYSLGPAFTFMISALVTAIVAVYFIFSVKVR